MYTKKLYSIVREIRVGNNLNVHQQENGEVKHGIANAGILYYHEKETIISSKYRMDDSEEYFE